MKDMEIWAISCAQTQAQKVKFDSLTPDPTNSIPIPHQEGDQGGPMDHIAGEHGATAGQTRELADAQPAPIHRSTWQFGALVYGCRGTRDDRRWWNRRTTWVRNKKKHGSGDPEIGTTTTSLGSKSQCSKEQWMEKEVPPAMEIKLVTTTTSDHQQGTWDWASCPPRWKSSSLLAWVIQPRECWAINRTHKLQTSKKQWGGHQPFDNASSSNVSAPKIKHLEIMEHKGKTMVRDVAWWKSFDIFSVHFWYFWLPIRGHQLSVVGILPRSTLKKTVRASPVPSSSGMASKQLRTMRQQR